MNIEIELLPYVEIEMNRKCTEDVSGHLQIWANANFFNGSKYIAIASHNEKVIAYVLFFFDKDNSKVWSIFTSPRYRRNGIAILLIRKALDYIHHRSGTKASILFHEDETAARQGLIKRIKDLRAEYQGIEFKITGAGETAHT